MWKILQGGFRESNAAAGTATEPAVMATPPAKFYFTLGRGYIHVSRAVRDLSGPYQLASGSQIPGKSPCQPVNLPLSGRSKGAILQPEAGVLTHTHFNWTDFQRVDPAGGRTIRHFSNATLNDTLGRTTAAHSGRGP